MREINHNNKFLKCMHTMGLVLGGHQQSCEGTIISSDKETESQRHLST